MRVLLVGSPSERARLRTQLTGSMEIAGEYATLGAARAADVDADAILLGSSPALEDAEGRASTSP